MSIKIIPCLDIKDAQVVKGVKFGDLKGAGDPISLAITYAQAGADELMLLDINSSANTKPIMLNIVKKILEEIKVPLVVGGGLCQLGELDSLINTGVAKVILGSASFKDPSLVSQSAHIYGKERIVLALDAKKNPQGGWSVYLEGGKTNTHKDVISWAMELEDLGAGELLLTSIDQDGTKNGYDLKLLKAVTEKVKIPVIASGGAGKLEHFYEAVAYGGASSLLAASLFHYGEIEINQLKDYLAQRNIKINKRDC